MSFDSKIAKNAFMIIGKDLYHRRKIYFNVYMFKIRDDYPNRGILRYIEKPIFKGMVEFYKSDDKFEILGFWKRINPPNVKNLKLDLEKNLKPINPRIFEQMFKNAAFIALPIEQEQEIETEPIYEIADRYQNIEIRRYTLCEHCKKKRKFTLLGKDAHFIGLNKKKICKNCAGKEVFQILKNDYQLKVTPQLKNLMSKQLIKFRSVPKVTQMLLPNFNPLVNKELTLYDKKTESKSLINRMQKIGSINIKELDIPQILKQYFNRNKIFRLLPIQVLAIEAGLLKKKKNLLVVSSTSSGKTMLGELTGFNKIIVDKLSKNPIPSDILKLKGDLRKEKLKIFNRKLSKIRSNSKMLYLVPIVALANLRYEEYKILKNFGITPALKVGKSFMDDDLPNEFGSMEKADLIIGTYEAIDVILRSGGKNSLGNVETIVIDEIQMLNDVDRGWVLDGLIARIRYLYPNAQLILLSATISDPKLLSDHYKCQLIEFNGRPVPMERHLILFLSDFEKQKALLYLVEDEFKKKSKYGYKGQSLIFTNSRRKCHAISDFLYNNRISAAAYHSGLTHQDRRKIEKKFSKQHISCVVTTAALAAGVDFPASQVIFESLSMGIKNLTVAEFEQMSGRAGRYLKHEQAKVIILCQPGKVSHSSQLETEEKVAFRLLKGKIESIQLEPENINMYTEVLAFISMISRSKTNSKKKPGTKNDIRHFQNNMLNNDFSLDSCLKYLQSNNFLRIGKNRSNGSLEFYTTPFGKASASSFFKVDICLKIKKCLEEGKNLFDLKEEEENGIEYEDGEIEDENLKEKNKKIDNKNSKNLIDTNLAVSMAFDLHPFKNIYVSNSVLKEISSKSGGQKSSSLLFSNSTLSLLSADSLSKNRKSRLSRFITDLLLIWTHDIFNCECKESPYCNCGKNNVQKRILQLRLEGKYPNEIQKWLKKNWNIKIFTGDLIDFFDGLIYILRSIYKIGKNITISDDIKENLDEIPNLLSFFKLR